MRHVNRRTIFTVLLTLAASLAGCTVPNPNYRPRSDANTSDAGIDDADPSTIIRVTVTGDDAADGITAPVKTLKRAIALANENAGIKTIRLSAGKYDVVNGERFPYAVPKGIRLVGEPGVIFAGTTVEIGVVLETGGLESIQFEGFMTAIRVTGMAQLSNIAVTKSFTAVAADGMADLSASELTFTGSADSGCLGIGLTAQSMANVSIDKLVATDVVAVSTYGQSVVAVSKANATKSQNCQFGSFVMAAGGKSFTLADSMLTGGSYGLLLTNTSGLHATLTNTTVADAGEGIYGEAHVFNMTNGEVRNNKGNGALLNGGSITFTNVNVKENSKSGIEISSQSSPAALTMRGCSVTGNGNGIALRQGANGDFGNSTSAGNNSIRGNAMIGLLFDHCNQTISAAGNIWTPGIQGADAQGRYSSQLYSGSASPTVNGNNFGMVSGVFLYL